MTVYKIYHEMRIEATDSEDATNRLIEQNGIGDEFFTANKDEAVNRFSEIKKSLGAPHYLGKGIYWFDGVILEKADDCDEDENESLESTFYTAFCCDIMSCALGK